VLNASRPPSPLARVTSTKGRPPHVVADEEVEPPVAIEVHPHRRRAERLAAAKPAGACHVDEGALPRVVKQAVLADRRDEHIGKPVVVVVANGHAHSVHLGVETGRARDVGEGAVPVVPVEAQRGSRPSSPESRVPSPGRLARPVHPVHEQDVLPAIGVVVQERAARAHRLGEELASVGAASVAKLEAGRRGDVDEPKPG